jgi:hypothetical protein
VIALLDVARRLLADVLRFAIVALRPTRIVAAENLFLRRQLAMYVERGVKPHERPERVDFGRSFKSPYVRARCVRAFSVRVCPLSGSRHPHGTTTTSR